MENHEKEHITEYSLIGKVLVALLILTMLTVTSTMVHLAAWSVAVALIIACIKGFLVLAFFMHLKFDRLIFKVMAGGVFALFALFIIITFLDYLFR